MFSSKIGVPELISINKIKKDSAGVWTFNYLIDKQKLYHLSNDIIRYLSSLIIKLVKKAKKLAVINLEEKISI